MTDRVFEMDISVIEGYRNEHKQLATLYEAVDSSEVLSPVSEFMPKSSSLIVDIGAGTGRDANYFASMEHIVFAVEPVDEFREFSAAIRPNSSIEWVRDTLPSLPVVQKLNMKFDFILISGVWHHLCEEDQKTAFESLREILKNDGRVIMSLRHGPGAESRRCYPIDVALTQNMAVKSGFKVVCCKQADSVQIANKIAGVHWDWLVLDRFW